MANVNANAPLAMTGEQFQHLANLFVTNQAQNLRHREVESAKILIDRCDGSIPERTRKWIRELDKWETEETGTDFLFDLVKKTTYGNLRQTTKTWMSQTDPAITWLQLREKVSNQFLSSVEQTKMQTALEGAKQKPDKPWRLTSDSSSLTQTAPTLLREVHQMR